MKNALLKEAPLLSLHVTELTHYRTLFVGNFHKSLFVLRLQLIGGFETVGTQFTAAEAINSYSSLKPDIIFVHVAMADMSGFEVARFIKEQDARIKIIMVSEKFNIEFLRTSMEIDTDGYLPKNISF